MKLRLFSLIAVFAVFTLYTAEVVFAQGYTGFLELAVADAWGGQMFLDLGIALVLFTFWMVPDSRERGITVWPYFVAILTTGSIGALAYLIHRTAKEAGGAEAARRDAAAA